MKSSLAMLLMFVSVDCFALKGKSSDFMFLIGGRICRNVRFELFTPRARLGERLPSDPRRGIAKRVKPCRLCCLGDVASRRRVAS